MRKKLYLALAISLATLPMVGPAQAQDLTEDRVRALVLETIRENPEIVMEAVAILQERDAQTQAAAVAEVLSSKRDRLENDPNAPVLGNPDGDVTVVEFFDYNCPYCRQADPEIRALLKADPNIRLVLREWPILGDGSVFATRAALAARAQGKYEAMHWGLLGMNGRANEASVMALAADLGLDLDQLRADMKAPEIDAHIEVSMDLTQALGFNGTPSFVIGDALVPGFVPQSELEMLVNDARETSE